jgi:Zn-finger nucleic acid-binding protein
LEAAVFEELVRRARNNTLRGDAVLSEIFAKSDKGEATTTLTDSSGAWRYRHCPVCKSMMQRRHYAKGSGVIIDLCRHDGVWFDADELHRILLWVRSGGLQRAQQRHLEGDRAAERQRFASSPSPVGAWNEQERNRTGDLTNIANVLASLFQIF